MTKLPPDPARKTASLIQGPTELLEYPIDHFDFYADTWHETVLNDQIKFLKIYLCRKPPNKPNQIDDCIQSYFSIKL